VTIPAPVVVPTKPEIVVVPAPVAVVKVLPNTGSPVLAGVRVIQPILFNPDSAKLDAGDLKSIASVLDVVQGQKGTLLITGFVKYTGRSAAADRKLAAARAQVVAKALAKFGVTVKIGYLGYGPQNKLNPKATDRKVEVRWVAAS
jgi:outer membrane protein OmpA-like peptidoglycan-associated protein